jgi:hypothetical protein
MAYITGTVTNANPGPTLYALMAAELTTLGFTLTDTVVIGVRTHKVWLSPAAGNAMGKDWYLDIAYTTTGPGTLFMSVMEFFDPATDLAYRAAFGSGSVRSADAVYFSPWGATGNSLESTNWNYFATATVAAANNGNLDLTASAFGYWITLTRDRVVVMVSNNPTFMIYAGTFVPSAAHAAAAGADVYPLVAAKITGAGFTGTQACGITRMPKHTTASSFTWNMLLQAALVGTNSAALKAPGFPADHTTVSGRMAGLIPVSTDGNAGAGVATAPRAWLGTLRDVASVVADASVARGDTVSDGTNSWVLSTGVTVAAMMKMV